MVWKFSWLQSWDEVWSPANLEQWQAAFAREAEAHATPFMHPAVVRAWLQARCQERYDPFFFWASHPDGRQAGFLMVRRKPDWRQGFARHMAPVGGEQFDYHEPVVLGGRAPGGGFWADLERELRRYQGAWFDVLHLPGIRTGCLDGADDARDAAPFVRLGSYADIDQYLMSRSKKLRGVVRRTLRRLEAEGAVDFTVHGPDDLGTVLAWIPTLVAEKRRKYPSRYPAKDAEIYLANLATEGLASGVVHCSSLSLDGRSISWEINFYLKGVLYGYACASDGRFAQVSLGSLHNYKVMEWLLQRNAQMYDFLVGQETYKHHWTDGEAFRLRGLEIKSRAPASLLRRGVRRGLDALGRLPLPALPAAISGHLTRDVLAAPAWMHEALAMAAV